MTLNVGGIPADSGQIDELRAALAINAVITSMTQAELDAAVVADTLVKGAYSPSDIADALYWYDGASLIPAVSAPNIPQFSAETPVAGFSPLPASATGTVIATPFIFGFIRCLTAGTITGAYDATSAAGTNLLPSLAMTAGQEVGLCADAVLDYNEGVLFDVGLHLVIASGTYEVYFRPAVPANDTTYAPVKAWVKHVISADGTPPGLSAACMVRGVHCLTGGTIALWDFAGSAGGANFQPAVALSALGKTTYGRSGGRRNTTGVYADITGGTYVLLASPGV
jgi:hypothetical protein